MLLPCMVLPLHAVAACDRCTPPAITGACLVQPPRRLALLLVAAVSACVPMATLDQWSGCHATGRGCRVTPLRAAPGPLQLQVRQQRPAASFGPAALALQGPAASAASQPGPGHLQAELTVVCCLEVLLWTPSLEGRQHSGVL